MNQGGRPRISRDSFYQRRPLVVGRGGARMTPFGPSDQPLFAPLPAEQPARRRRTSAGPARPAGRQASRSRVLQRGQFKHAPRRRRVRLSSSWRSKLLTGMACALFIYGIGVGVMSLRANHTAAAQVHKLTRQSANGGTAGDAAAEESSIPDETQPPALDGYKVAAAMPRYLRIPSIGVNARVLRTTVNSRNQLGVPPNIFDTAWFDGSAKPGDPGAVLIDGHVSGPTKDGVFINLKKLKAGDAITLERGDGKLLTYKVVTTKTYDADKVDMAAAMTPVTAGKPGLNLITCTGKVDSSGNHFQQRLVVFAAQQ